MDDIVKEFLIEGYEYLNSLDSDLIEMEAQNSDPEILNRVFRAVHTIKGTSGFLAYNKLVSITHVGEGLLDSLRTEAIVSSEATTSALLSLVDAIRQILVCIEETEQEGDVDYSDLVATLSALQEKGASAPPGSTVSNTSPDVSEIDQSPSLAAESSVETIPELPDNSTQESMSNTLPEQKVEMKEDASERVSNTATAANPALERLRLLELLKVIHNECGEPVQLIELATRMGKEIETVIMYLTMLEKEGLIQSIDDKYSPNLEGVSFLTQAATDQQSTPAMQPQQSAAAQQPQQSAVAEQPPQSAAAERPQQSTPAKQPQQSSSEKQKSSLSGNSIRVDVELLDGLMNLVGELVLTRNQIVQFAGTQADTAFAVSAQHLDLITTELQEGVMKTRMQPIGNVWSKFPRVVRDIAVQCNKKVRVEMEGADTELDKTIIEAIKDPLTHLIRNAVDHGIEVPENRVAAGKPPEGILSMRAFHEGGQVNIEIIDNGAGMDLDRLKAKAVKSGIITQASAEKMSDREVLQLVFMPGFSTAKQVSNISGRGVGMDVVKTNIEKIGGTVDVQSKLGYGTTFKIKIPLTLAIIPALIVHQGPRTFAIPQVNLLELVRLEGSQIESGIEMIHDTPVYRLRGKILPLIYLDRELEITDDSSDIDDSSDSSDADSAERSDAVNIVVLQADDQDFGLVVEEIVDTEEVVVKPLGRQIKSISAFAGATIMGDGKIALILDVLGLAQRAGVLADEVRAHSDDNVSDDEADSNEESLLLLRLGDDHQLAIPLSKVSRLEEISAQQIEWAGPQELVQYRGHLMPLIQLSSVLGVENDNVEDRLMQVVVCGQEGSPVGLVVDEILDVVEEAITLNESGSHEQISGVTVVHEKVTELLNVENIVNTNLAHYEYFENLGETSGY